MANGVVGFRIENRAGKQGIEGLREFNRAARALGDDTKTAMKPTHLEAAEIVAREARKLSPARTGRLRNSIVGRAVQSGGRVRIGFGGGVPYAGPIHFGWPARRIRPQPFVYDALDPRRADLVRLYEARIDELTKRHKLR
jgi:hypothetical protein